MSKSPLSSGQVKTSDGTKWYSYSGMIVGDVSVPATISLTSIPNTGLSDSFIKIKYILSQPVSTASNAQLGIIVKINDIEVINSQTAHNEQFLQDEFELFVPMQSKLEILSLNTSANNTQERGVNTMGWYI